jgi:hypothetical protein
MGSDSDSKALDYALTEVAYAESGARNNGNADTVMIISAISALTTAVVTVGRILLDRLPERKESDHAE